MTVESMTKIQHPDVKKIALTGGPCAGKTSVIDVLREEYAKRVLFVPEVPTLLLRAGFPRPNVDVPYTPQWQQHFQRTVLTTQVAMESIYEEMAIENGIDVMVCDRGLLDGAAYLPGGLTELEQDYGVSIPHALGRYACVVHLESLATAEPGRFGNGNNGERYEDLERAQQIEGLTRLAWSDHEQHIYIEGADLEEKILRVGAIVGQMVLGVSTPAS